MVKYEPMYHHIKAMGKGGAGGCIITQWLTLSILHQSISISKSTVMSYSSSCGFLFSSEKLFSLTHPFIIIDSMLSCWKFLTVKKTSIKGWYNILIYNCILLYNITYNTMQLEKACLTQSHFLWLIAHLGNDLRIYWNQSFCFW